MSGYGIDVEQFRSLVVRPALQRIDLWSIAAENLVLGTCMKESLLQFVKQVGGGPALGFGQMEPPTHDDCYINYMNARPVLKRKVMELSSHCTTDYPDAREMIGNAPYAIAMVRIRYLRAPGSVPPSENALELCRYWKQHYNTPGGKGTVEEALPHFKRALECRS